MFFLSARDIYEINEQVTGATPVVRDARLLRAAAARPFQRMFGHEPYPGLIEKAAALLHALAHDHLFVDGNKRTAQLAVTRFLEGNGAHILWDEAEARAFILEIAKGGYDVDAVTAWMLDRTRLDDGGA